MTTTLRALVFGLVLAACGGSTASVDPASSSGDPPAPSTSPSNPPPPTTLPVPQEQVHLEPPATGLEVTATIVSVTLGEDCGAAGISGDCAPDPGGRGGCGLTCQQSNVQLSFKTGTGTAATVEITSVTLHDAKTGAKVDTLTASAPKSWTGNTYAPWNEVLAPSSDLKASYDLSAPAWSTIGSSSYSAQYRLRVTLRIDGALVTLESTLLSREPAVAT